MLVVKNRKYYAMPSKLRRFFYKLMETPIPPLFPSSKKAPNLGVKKYLAPACIPQPKVFPKIPRLKPGYKSNSAGRSKILFKCTFPLPYRKKLEESLLSLK